MMLRVARFVLGVVLVLVFVGWIGFRRVEPMRSWIDAAGDLGGLALWGVACLCCFGGVALIASAWQAVSAEPETTPGDAASVDADNRPR